MPNCNFSISRDHEHRHILAVYRGNDHDLFCTVCDSQINVAGDWQTWMRTHAECRPAQIAFNTIAEPSPETVETLEKMAKLAVQNR